MQLRRALYVLFGVSVASIAACNGVTGSSGGSFASGDSVSGGSSSGPDGVTGKPVSASSVCPQLQPVVGEGCARGTCEYGRAADPACNVIAKCNDFSTWEIYPPDHCPTTCPARFDERVPGAECDGPDVCTYLEATCGCAGATGQSVLADGGDGGGDGGDGGSADSGAAALGHWQCVRPAGGCPARRPVIGTACTKSMTCDYGTCLFGVPLTFECNYAIWQQPASVPACP